MRQIKSFLVIGTILGSIFMLSIVYFSISSWYEKVVAQHTASVSKNISQTVMNSLFQIMRKGWQRNDVMEFLEANKEAFQETPYTVTIYRGKIVESSYGKIEQPAADSGVKAAFNNGDDLNLRKGNVFRYIHPLKARRECLGCHTNAIIGDVLGVVDIMQDIGPTINEGKMKLRLFLLLISPLPIAGAAIIANFFSRKISKGVQLLHERVDSINNIRDLRSIELDSISFPFEELNALFNGVKKLSEKLKNVAVDKNVMEFEIKLLEKFIITSELVKDWKDHISHLLLETNRIIESYCLFTLFVVNEEVYAVEIFWRNTPNTSTKHLFEEVIKEKLKQHPQFRSLPHVHINHTVILPLTHLPDLTKQDIELQTKTLLLDRPKIGGIVGIGINSSVLNEPTVSLVVESILTTLLNVVGSIKAIYKYTKDLEYYATRDPLTDLFNQRVFWEMLEYEIEKAKRHNAKLAIMVVDIDNFKIINDVYGHIFGDKFLQSFASTLRGIFRSEDILARYGGDEFAGIMFEANEEQAFFTAKRIKEGLKDFSLKAPDGSIVRTTVSIGISIFPDHAKAAKELFIVADSMMASAKSLGKDRIAIPTYDDITEIFKDISEKNIMIINALEEKRIVPYFQPIVNSNTGRADAYEALMRIQLDNGDIIAAGEFIELASDIGVINRMEHILMEKVFQHMKEKRYDGSIFLNISPKALIFSEFIPNVRRMVKEYGIEASKVIFEITERDTVKNLNLLERFVNDLKFEGFKFAIDDFGSGFSSFQYVKRFPIDFVKLEGEFVRNMVGDGEVDSAIVNSIAIFANSLGIKTVAEYVESEEILKAVKEIGINYAQGYHFGQPAPELGTDIKMP